VAQDARAWDRTPLSIEHGAWAPFRPKVDGIEPQTQHVNLRIMGQPE